MAPDFPMPGRGPIANPVAELLTYSTGSADIARGAFRESGVAPTRIRRFVTLPAPRSGSEYWFDRCRREKDRMSTHVTTNDG